MRVRDLLAVLRSKLAGCGHLLREEPGDFLAGPRRSELEGLVKMDAALGYACNRLRSSSGSSFSLSAVEPTRSKNITVSWRRSPGGAAAVCGVELSAAGCPSS
jgi:hypothetical protein